MGDLRTKRQKSIFEWDRDEKRVQRNNLDAKRESWTNVEADIVYGREKGLSVTDMVIREGNNSSFLSENEETGNWETKVVLDMDLFLHEN